VGGEGDGEAETGAAKPFVMGLIDVAALKSSSMMQSGRGGTGSVGPWSVVSRALVGPLKPRKTARLCRLCLLVP
jgi:hypothetical protein